MVDSTKVKIPFSDIQVYLEKHEDLILGLIKFEKNGLMSRAELEEKLPQALMKIHECITSIFKKNNII